MKNNHNKLMILSAAAVLLNGAAQDTFANPPDGKTKVDYRYSAYDEKDIARNKLSMGSSSRYSIDVHHAKIKTPISSNTELSAYVISETMSGASPYYVTEVDGELLQVMSGATIDESRVELGLDYRSYHDKTEHTVSASYSSENDYRSVGFGYSAALRFNNNLTTIDYGFSGSRDEIDANNAHTDPMRPVGEHKNRLGVSAGISHIAAKNRVLSLSAGLTSLNGYLSDSYKKAVVLGPSSGIVHDSRPDTQQQTSVVASWREYFPLVNAALHVNYSFYRNDWKLDSNTVDLSWYQNIGDGWQLIPSYRYYEQDAATFYQPVYYALRIDGYYSSDYRLSEFSAESVKLKLNKQFKNFRFNVSYERYTSKGDHPGLVEFDHVGLAIGRDF